MIAFIDENRDSRDNKQQESPRRLPRYAASARPKSAAAPSKKRKIDCPSAGD
ncbi:hypothetical protein [Vitreimonas flagellata]|uniref:hypothetical protein n=1 Tax=Vitreimonas flagellata TaxID=2560861 RepID=UPI001431EF04|nr:hypothetical protein [Vitreimonas flagellata]